MRPENPDRSESLLSALINIDQVLRSYANLLVFLYKHRYSAYIEVSEIIKKEYPDFFKEHASLLDTLGEKHEEEIFVPRIVGRFQKVPADQRVRFYISRETGKPEYYRVEDLKTGEARYYKMVSEKEKSDSRR